MAQVKLHQLQDMSADLNLVNVKFKRSNIEMGRKIVEIPKWTRLKRLSNRGGLYLTRSFFEEYLS